MCRGHVYGRAQRRRERIQAAVNAPMEPSVAALTEAEIRRERSITPTADRVLRTTGPRVLYVGGGRRPALSEPQVSVGETIRAQQIMPTTTKDSILG